MYERTFNISRIKFYGRWASENSLGHYIQEAHSAAALFSLSFQSEARLQLVRDELRRHRLSPGLERYEYEELVAYARH